MCGRFPACVRSLARADRDARQAAAAESGCFPEESARRFSSLFHVSVYIDDATGASLDDLLFGADGSPIIEDGVHVRRASKHFQLAIQALKDFGVASSRRKEQPPAVSVESLGLEIDLEEDRMRILPSRRRSYVKAIAALLEQKSCPVDDLRSVLGKLLFAAACFPRGRRWLDPIWRLTHVKFRTHDGSVILSRNARAGLAKWSHTLQSSMADGVPLAHGAFPTFGSPETCAIYADASGQDGWCAWCAHDGRCFFTSGTWTEDELADGSFIIAEKELLASTLGLVTLAPLVGAKFVYSWTDNTNAQAAMRRLQPRSDRMRQMVDARCAWMSQAGILESAERITSSANLWADMGSRRQVQEAMGQARALDLEVVTVHPPPEWRSTSLLREGVEGRWGPSFE